MRTAVIGVGRMGRRHLAAACIAGLEIVGVADTNAPSLESAAADFGLTAAQLFDVPRMMLQELRPELVIVATTAPAHADLTCAAAESGAAAVLCEKPMATSIADCDRMIEVCDARGVRLAVNHQARFVPHYTVPMELSRSDEFGGLTSISVVAGNFGLAMNGTHRVDALAFMTGSTPRNVTAWFSDERIPNPRGPQFEDRAGSFRVVTESGKRLFVESSADQGHGIQSIYACRNGQIIVDELAGVITTTVRSAADRQQPTTRYAMPAVRDTQSIPPSDALHSTAALLRALVTGGGYPTGLEARQAVTILVGAYLSAENQHVTIDVKTDPLPRERHFPWA